MDLDISENLKRIRFEIGEAKEKYREPDDTVRIMAVTKTVDCDRINEAVKEGITLLGENRVQEYLDKRDFYDKSAEVHFIGHLQTNKVKYIADSVTMIHSVDSARLAAEIDRQAGRAGKKLDVLLEVNIGGEDSKSGVLPEELDGLFYKTAQLENITVRGLMTIPPIGESERAFERLQRLFEEMKSRDSGFDTLSMGMSADFALAVKYGSNIVRIGSRIFGARK